MARISSISSSKHKPQWTALLFLAATTLLVYAVSLSNSFTMDDEVIIINNTQTSSLRNIPSVLLSPDLVKPYYRPLNRASYLFDYQLAGMNPMWYHGVNIIIHVGNAILLYLIVNWLLADKTAALITALIFGIHPVNAEAVNFISARNTLMSLFFCQASFLAFIDMREKEKRLSLPSALLFFCGLLSKETAFMLIGVIALYIFFPLPGQTERMGRKTRFSFVLPYLCVSIVYFVMRSYSLQGIVGTTIPVDGLFSRLAQNYHIIPQYFILLLFPLNLTLFHKVPDGGILTPLWFLPTWLLLPAAAWLIIRSRNQMAQFGLAWFVINYAPIANIVPIPSNLIAERYLYMPAVGYFMVLGVFFSSLQARETSRKVLYGITAVVVVAYAVLTVQRNLDWKNNLALYSSEVRHDPCSPAAHYNLGTAYRAVGDLASAEKEWEKTLAIAPTYSDALTQMGTLSAIQGDLVRAEQYYISALRAPLGVADPDKAMAHYNLGKIYERWHQPQQALQHYQQFLENVSIYYLEYKPDAEERIALLRAVLSIRPESRAHQ